MKYDYRVTQDGHTYEPGTDVPDMGSVKCIKAEGNRRDSVFLRADSSRHTMICPAEVAHWR